MHHVSPVCVLNLGCRFHIEYAPPWKTDPRSIFPKEHGPALYHFDTGIYPIHIIEYGPPLENGPWVHNL